MEEIADIQRSRNWRVTTICDIDSIVFDNASENTGIHNGVGALLNKERKKLRIDCDDLVSKGCYDHILNLISKLYRKRFDQSILSSPDRYKNLISDGKCIVYDVIARMQNTNIRHRWTHQFRYFAESRQVHIDYTIVDTENRYIAGERTGANILNALGVDKLVRRLMGVSSDADASKLDARDTTATSDPYFVYSLHIMSVLNSLHRMYMHEVDKIKELNAYCGYITAQFKLLSLYLSRLQSSDEFVQQETLKHLFNLADIQINSLLDDPTAVLFFRDHFIIYLECYVEMIMKHDGNFIDDEDDNDIDDSQDNSETRSTAQSYAKRFNNGDRKIKLIRTTSRVVERLLGTVMKILKRNNRMRAVLLRSILRLKTLQFNWMCLFNFDEREAHYREGLKLLSNDKTQLQISQEITLKKIRENIVKEADLKKKQERKAAAEAEKRRLEAEKAEKERKKSEEKELISDSVNYLLDDSSFQIEKVTVDNLKSAVDLINDHHQQKQINKSGLRRDLIEKIVGKAVAKTLVNIQHMYRYQHMIFLYPRSIQ
jgi:hypothetical protein